MAPSTGKRKRPDRQFSQEEGSGRPPPHRPENLSMAHEQNATTPTRNTRRGRQQSQQDLQSTTAGATAATRSQEHAASPTPQTAALQQLDGANTQPPTRTGDQHTAPVPYAYDYLTEEVLKDWSRRNEEVRAAAQEMDWSQSGILIQELIRAALDGLLSASDAGAMIQRMIEDGEQQSDSDIQSQLLNTLSLLEDADSKNPNLLALVAATAIDPEVIRQELDVPLLQSLSLVRSTFERMRTRKTTNLLYRQANFNLLREESEGYAKLITEYFNTANEAVLDPGVSAEIAFQRIMALVGSFDLDVGRVLDITLDISANLLVRAYGFFVKFYRCSSWWPEDGMLDNVKWEDQGFSSFPRWAVPGYDNNMPEAIQQQKKQQLDLARSNRDVRFWARVKDVGMDAFFELGARRIVDFDSVSELLGIEFAPEFDARNNEINADRRKRINENRRYMRETKTLPPQGNSDAAQLLGFKLRFYASSAREANDVLPENLVFLAALLIKIGFISLRDLYPHLHPSDEQMPEEKARMEKEKREKEMKERPGGGSNALAMAGALTDDTIPAPRNLRDKERSGGGTPKPDKKDEEFQEELPAPTNQKVLLVKALLLIGALPEALFILGRFPWMVDVDRSLPPYLHRIARQMLSKISESIKPLDDRAGLQNPSDEVKDNVPGPAGVLKFDQRNSKRPTRWLGLDQIDKGDGQTYRHYYPDWDDNVPVCHTVEDVFLLCNTFTGLLGVKIGQDAELLSMLVRIGRHDLASDSSEVNRTRWLELSKRLLVPALSLSKHNPGLTQEVYQLLEFFPTPTRYNIYAEWYTGKTSRLPDIRVAFEHNRAEVKDVLRRVTNETGKKQARVLSKVSFSSPGIVMMSMINQLESYSNMIPSLVECTRYFSAMAWDVLTWCLINSLSGQGRDRIQADGMLTSPWLQALSQFVASLFLRYSNVNPSPVLQYLASELRAGNSTDLEMFEQVLTEMAGIRPDMEFNDAQVLAMAGGEHLQAQTILQLADKRNSRKSSASRLMTALEAPGLIGQTLIAIAQERQMYSNHESAKFMPLKVLGNNLDKIQSVFAQYLEVLKTNLSPFEFAQSVPDIIGLIKDFGLEPGIAFTICRYVVVNTMSETDSTKKQELDSKSLTNGDKAATETIDNKREGQTPAPDLKDGEDVKMTSAPPSSFPNASASNDQPWHPVLNSIISRLLETCPDLSARISIPFFVTFWTLTLQDILVHTPSYDKEINKLRDQIKEITADRSDASAVALKERERKKKTATEIQDNLRTELKGRISVYQKTRNRLSRREKDHWFSRTTEKKDIDARHLGLLQECFLPRAMLSSLDAHYCFLMLKILHDNGTPGFSTMHLLNQLIRKHELAAIMFQCTAVEAQHFGRFLCETFKLLQHWHSDRVVYEKEALGGKQKLPGFAKKLDAHGEPESILEYEEFRRLLFNWHSFFNNALQMCFESGEYMHIRNGIIVLKSVVQVFPTLNFMGHNMVKHVTKLSEEDKRSDLKLAAMSLLGPLRNREKQWMMPQAFRLNDSGKDGARSANGRTSSARPETPQIHTADHKLSAVAAEFKPTFGATMGDAGKKEAAPGPEDGEIDEKPTAAQNTDSEMLDAPAVLEADDPAQADKQVRKGPVIGSEEANSPMTIKDAGLASSKPSTPGPMPNRIVHSSAQMSQFTPTRPPSSQSASARPPHALPSRPENVSTIKTNPNSQTDRPGRITSRVEERFGRLDRPEESQSGSRTQSPGSHSYARTPERELFGRAPPREERGFPRDIRGQGLPSTRDSSRSSSRLDAPPSARDHGGSEGPHYPTERNHTLSTVAGPVAGPVTSTTGSTEPQGTKGSQNDSQHRENPARLALISEDHLHDKEQQGSDTTRDSWRDQGQREERGPVWQDPRGYGKVGPPEPFRDHPGRPDSMGDLAPTGPRRGRLSRDMGPPHLQESSYGRLNGPSDSPRTPHGPPSTRGRNFTAPHGPPSMRQNENMTSVAASSHPPDSHATFRGPPRPPADRGPGPQVDRPPSSNSLPTTPVSDSGAMVHPSRMAQLNSQPHALQTNLPTNNPHTSGSPTSATPMGPRGVNRPPAGTSAGSPTGQPGPSAGTNVGGEKYMRGDRQRASINATLQNSHGATASNGQNVSFRGAAQNRQSDVSQFSISQPVSAIASPIEPPPRRGDGLLRQDGPNHGRMDGRNDLFQNRSDRGEEGNGRDMNRMPRRRGNDEQHHHRGGGHLHNNMGRDRRPTEDYEQPQRQFAPSFDPVDKRRNRDDREGRGGHAWVGGDDMRRPPSEQVGSFAGPTGPGPANEWQRNSYEGGRGPPRHHGGEDGRRGGRGGVRMGGRMDDFRSAARREEDGNNRGGPGPNTGPGLRDESGGPPPPNMFVNRKRRHDDGPPTNFDESKRRRSGV